MVKILDFVKDGGSSGKYFVVHERKLVIGEIFAKEDGFYDFWPDTKVWGRGGCWPSYILREIAEKLEELNKPLEEELDNYFTSNTQ